MVSMRSKAADYSGMLVAMKSRINDHPKPALHPIDVENYDASHSDDEDEAEKDLILWCGVLAEKKNATGSTLKIKVANVILREFILVNLDKQLLQDEAENRKKNFILAIKALAKNPSKQVGQAFENMLKIGRLVTQSTLDLKE
ncbi:hypothetical protein Tco_1169717, partial [Tanacetum coccineum]